MLSEPEFATGKIVIAAPDFGTESPREHAVWALLNHGFHPGSPTFSEVTLENQVCFPRDRSWSDLLSAARPESRTPDASGIAASTTPILTDCRLF